MVTIDALLRAALVNGAEGRRLALPPELQGLPDTAHGGSVLAAFDALGEVAGPRLVTGVYRRRVPLGVPLPLAVARTDAGIACVLRDESGAVLVDGRVAPAADAEAASRSGAAGSARNDTRPPTAPDLEPHAQHPLPVSRTCFACGTDNPAGLQVHLAFDACAVRGTWAPRAPFAAEDGTLAPAALTTLLDETAFWVGALATGESGMTTDLAVALHRAVPFGEPVTVSGARATARPQADARYWDTEVAAHDAAGGLVASARITFVAVRGAARRLVTGMLAMNEPDVVARVFPAYAR